MKNTKQKEKDINNYLNKIKYEVIKETEEANYTNIQKNIEEKTYLKRLFENLLLNKNNALEI